MAKQTFGIKATPDVNYDLDKIKADSRTNPDLVLQAYIWKWNPKNSGALHRNPNPKKPPLASVWLSSKTNEEIPDPEDVKD